MEILIRDQRAGLGRGLAGFRVQSEGLGLRKSTGPTKIGHQQELPCRPKKLLTRTRGTIDTNYSELIFHSISANMPSHDQTATGATV